MFERVCRREFGAIGVATLERLAPSVQRLAGLARDLDSLDVRLVVLAHDLDTAAPSGRLLFGLLAELATLERGAARSRRAPSGCRAPALRGDPLRRARALRDGGDSLRSVQLKLAAQGVDVSLGALHRALA